MRRIRISLSLAGLAMLMAISSCELDPSGPGWHSITRQGIEFAWNVEGSQLEVELTGPTTGWVLVGFKGAQLYHDANIIIGYVSGGVVHVRDDFGIDSQTHESDSSLQGGQQNATSTSGSEEGGSTTIAFTIPLDSGDEWDNAMEDGESILLVLATGADGADNFTSGYTLITTETISL